MKYINYIFIFLTLHSCNPNYNSKSERPILHDTVLTDIPNSRRNSESRKIKSKIESLAALEDIEKGYKDSAIRLWFTNSSNIEALFILTKKDGRWQGEFQKLDFVYSSDIDKSSIAKEDTLTSIKKMVKSLSPKSGWAVLMDSLDRLGLFILPDMELLKDYGLGTDGRWVTVEIATSEKYRIYSYQEPFSHANRFREAASMEKIGTLIENEFNYKRR